MKNSGASLNSLESNQERIPMDDANSTEYLKTKKSTNRHRILQTIVDLIVIVIIFAVFGLVYLFQDPKIQYFTCDNTDIFYPYKTDTVPFWAVGIFATFGPVLFIIPVELLNARLLPGLKKRKNDAFRSFLICTFHSLSLFILGISLTLCLTEIGKRWIGRLRPHFISVCQPDLTQLNCTSTTLSGIYYNPIYTGGGFCTNTNAAAVKEARFSFPSGHSSYSWYCMTFLIIYIEARLFLLRLRYIKPLIQLTAFIAAFVTMLSRVSDYHHRGSDVIGGTVLGFKT